MSSQSPERYFPQKLQSMRERRRLSRQMLADLYGCSVKTVTSKEGPALGVAILAMVGAGMYDSVPEACQAVIRTKQVQEPIPEQIPVYDRCYQMYRSLYPAMRNSFKALAKL